MTKQKLKSIGKLVLSKIPLFLFCVFFVKGYVLLFGEENTTTAITILTAMLIFLKNDLDFNLVQAAVSIPIMLVITAVSSKLALANPYWGIPINFLSIGLILIVSTHNVHKDNHVPFLLGYIFCQGYDVSGEMFTKRVVSMVIGGIIIAVIYLLVHKKQSFTLKFTDLFKSLNINTQETQWYIKLTCTLTLTMFLGSLVGFSKTMWVSFAVLSMIRPKREESVERMKFRLPATIVGSVIFFILFEFVVPMEYQQLVVIATGFIMMFIDNYVRKTVANSFSALMAAMLIFSTKEAMLLRIVANAVGLVIVILSQIGFKCLFNKLPPKPPKQLVENTTTSN